jgi:PiT family inorganic phosphate transporter
MFHFFHTAWEHFGTFPLAYVPLVVWLLIALALAFDFLNGLHDAANSIATVVSTRVLTPQAAVVWAAAFNFIAFAVFPLHVAETIQGDVIEQRLVQNYDFLAATLLAACAWNVLTWYLGLPTSSSHALIGGMVGAAVFTTGDFSGLKGGLLWIVLFIVLAPLIGVVLGSSIAVAVTWICRRQPPRRVDRIFRVGQLFSAAFFSLGHGGNDAQKTMGIIYLLLLTARPAMGLSADVKPPLPTEAVLACHLAMGLGTLWGGWRIVKTMGQKIIHLRPVDGFCAETGAALVLAMTTFVKGIPISTTHTITGSIVGVGTLKRRSAVRWGVAGNLVWAWVLTIPGAALAAMICLAAIRLLLPR